MLKLLPRNEMRVGVPYTNLRNRKNDPSPIPKDPFQESQLLYNEFVKVLEVDREWCFVEAVEQPYFDPSLGWIGYRGWIKTKDLIETGDKLTGDVVVINKWAEVVDESSQKIHVPFGTIFTVVGADESYAYVKLPNKVNGKIPCRAISFLNKARHRSALKNYSKIFLNDPYFWGGRSPYCINSIDSRFSSVDCSGLITLLYRTLGVFLPRNASHQYLVCQKIVQGQLRIGDLIFSADRGRSGHINHVMLYLGGGNIIEATMSTGIIQEATLLDKFEGVLSQGRSHEIVTHNKIFSFGRPKML